MAKYTTEVYENFKEEKKAKALEELSPEEKEVVGKIFEEAHQPTELQDGDIVCGEGELDIRKLSQENRDQMIFRVMVNNMVSLRRLNDALTDTTRLLMVLLRKLGVKNITKAIDETVEALAKEIGEFR